MDDRDLLARLAQGPASGDRLAAEAGTTRAAIWKRIEALRAAGVGIAARAGSGYALEHPIDLLDAQAIQDGLSPAARDALAGLEVVWSIDSTNSELLRRSTNVRKADVLLAERQTGGRGRRGRAWASPLAAHLYLSVARHFGGGLARLGGLPIVAGIAAAEALHASGHPNVKLKWPNDLVVEDDAALRKLGGLLVEGGGEHGGPVRAVIGLGLNVRMPAAFAREIDQPWCDLATLGDARTRNAIAASVLSHLLPALSAFDREGLDPFLARHAAVDALAGRAVVLHQHDGNRNAVAEGLAPDGALRVRLDDGEVRVVHSGEVSVRIRGA
ncbi:Biotin-protein ligase [Lysobacter dokdonensis DS-58]|uniref:Bifunctional ligase/repressor BirA n=1 Tax=Lysobacter dokdonensis DS-58 TaxID=1300345 RepID=A0A0A2WHW7_9GAMM|nr:biotin--[acetyl-CoA-carboxylase] ligase [Lysobacter dokdonensis]KGQ17860.1 Biotin-protein ligase [Lysobacter dokdonensis DS-58]